MAGEGGRGGTGSVRRKPRRPQGWHEVCGAVFAMRSALGCGQHEAVVVLFLVLLRIVNSPFGREWLGENRGISDQAGLSGFPGACRT